MNFQAPLKAFTDGVQFAKLKIEQAKLKSLG